MLQLKLEHGTLYLLGTPEALVVVDITCCSDNLTLGRIVGCDEIGVYSNTVSTYATTWLQDVYTRMLIGEVDEFPYVDASLVADE